MSPKELTAFRLDPELLTALRGVKEAERHSDRRASAPRGADVAGLERRESENGAQAGELQTLLSKSHAKLAFVAAAA